MTIFPTTTNLLRSTASWVSFYVGTITILISMYLIPIIADDHGYANMIVGDGSEMVECEIDPCDIVIEVDEEDKC